ncbi:MAG: hypothetical protein ACRDDY_13170 [Clostridium sp.]|uniref:hypothetical protein n=1 Tax=Clostridium sp. TaxID=1506 RepID=UPI003EE60E9D
MEKKLVVVDWLDTCDKCGNDTLHVKTENGSEEHLYDGDDVECPDCGLTGIAMVTDDYEDDSKIYVSWGDFE